MAVRLRVRGPGSASSPTVEQNVSVGNQRSRGPKSRCENWRQTVVLVLFAILCCTILVLWHRAVALCDPSWPPTEFQLTRSKLAVLGEPDLSPAAMSQLQFSGVVFAANFYNSREILMELLPELYKLALALSAANIAVYVSFVESGSKDGSDLLLREFAEVLTKAGIGHTISAEGASWTFDALCNVSGVPGCTGVTGETCLPPDSLRDCDHTIRIPIMATLRNQPLLPLFNGEVEAKTRVSAADFGILYVNDVLADAAALARLLQGRGQAYDIACGLDFSGMGLYDRWVVRSLRGDYLSQFYPYLQDPEAALQLRQGRPTRVYSCWNGVAVLSARPFVRSGVRFRSWRYGELRSPHKNAASLSPGEVFGRRQHQCAVSECQLICKDFWGVGAGKITIDPQVHVYYSRDARWLRRVFGPWLDLGTLLLGYVWRSPARPNYLYPDSAQAVPEAGLDLPHSRSESDSVYPPVHVPCGTSSTCATGRVMDAGDGHPCRWT